MTGCSQAKAARWRDIIFIPGQVGVAPDGTLPPDFPSQVQNAVDNFVAALSSQGGCPGTVLKVVAYLTAMDGLPVVHELWSRRFGPAPCWTSVEVRGLPLRSQIMLEGIASSAAPAPELPSPQAPVNDPYSRSDMTPRPSEWPRLDVAGRVVAVLTSSYANRGLRLINPQSRAVAAGQVHEVIATDEPGARPGGTVSSTAGLCFLEITGGGVMITGDRFVVEGQEIGTVVGFDETHMPNHMNIVVFRQTRASGLVLELKPGDAACFKRA